MNRISIANLGDINYLGNAFKKAEEEKKLNLVYLGGSITQGCNATTVEGRYVDLSAGWWKRRFPDAQIDYFNAGIGATTSQFGAARAEDHVLSRKPDVVFVEFSVNDSDNRLFLETYESLVRKLLTAPSVKAVVLINNLYYDTGLNAQGIHNAVGCHYRLPIISIRDNIYPDIAAGRIDPKEYSDDMLHPRDIGHRFIADMICGLLDAEYDIYKRNGVTGGKPQLMDKLTGARYENTKIYNNLSSEPKLDGFTADRHTGDDFCVPFKNGWTGSAKGSSVTFEGIKAGILLLQWRRTIRKPAPIASVIIDGDPSTRIILDANFDEDWGDLCALTTLTESADKTKEHTVTVTIEEEGSESDFMLISLIAADM
ncbi:MAG: SGNH/GDSL hydrolase family protein [Ruminococcus sp.]|nr:SGNH/GDSL hydrolase family protein [Ruminococcus sp.]